MNYDEMPAGAEIDIVIADKVMGWSIDPEGCFLDRNNDYANTEFGTTDNTYHKPAWMPSVRIAAAWQVVEKLDLEDFAIHKDSETDLWQCSWWGGVGDMDWRFAKADTAPLAICRAALKAMEEK